MNKFIWVSKQPKIKNEVLQYNIADGGLTASNVIMYYHAERFSAVCSWWAQKEVEHGCILGQMNILVPLKEWMLWEKSRRKDITGPIMTLYKVLIEVWNKLQEDLIVLPSLLISFLSHKNCLRASEESDFSEWIKRGMGRFMNLEKDGQFLEVDSLVQKMGRNLFSLPMCAITESG